MESCCGLLAVKHGPGSVLETKACDELMTTLGTWKGIRYHDKDLEPLK
ncbi:hypothetical protein V2J09_020770 [Rumex salicifolius]